MHAVDQGEVEAPPADRPAGLLAEPDLEVGLGRDGRVKAFEDSGYSTAQTAAAGTVRPVSSSAGAP